MFIYQYKYGDKVQVTPSKHETEKEVWDWVIYWLRPAGMTDDKQAEEDVRAMGEVVPVE